MISKKTPRQRLAIHAQLINHMKHGYKSYAYDKTDINHFLLQRSGHGDGPFIHLDCSDALDRWCHGLGDIGTLRWHLRVR